MTAAGDTVREAAERVTAPESATVVGRCDVPTIGGGVARDVAVTPVMLDLAHRAEAGDLCAGLALHQAVAIQMMTRALFGGARRGR